MLIEQTEADFDAALQAAEAALARLRAAAAVLSGTGANAIPTPSRDLSERLLQAQLRIHGLREPVQAAGRALNKYRHRLLDEEQRLAHERALVELYTIERDGVWRVSGRVKHLLGLWLVRNSAGRVVDQVEFNPKLEGSEADARAVAERIRAEHMQQRGQIRF